MFKYSNTNKRYHTFDYHLKQAFGKKVIKLSLNGGFTCPNIDGTKGVGGCTYCSSKGSGDYAGNPQFTIVQQLLSQKDILLHKWNTDKFIAYFQANTNTYAPLDKLKSLYEQALSVEGIVGISISTRPDCITEEIADYLQALSTKTYLIVELGLQTIHDSTAKLINRCHTYQDFLSGLRLLQDRGIQVCVHIINGLPGETKEMMLDTVKALSALPTRLHSIKIHLLHIINGTVMAQQFLDNQFKALEFDEYISLVCDQLELIPQEIVIQRLTGDGVASDLIAPLWSVNKHNVLNSIDKEMLNRNSYQGLKYTQAL